MNNKPTIILQPLKYIQITSNFKIYDPSPITLVEDAIYEVIGTRETTEYFTSKKGNYEIKVGNKTLVLPNTVQYRELSNIETLILYQKMVLVKTIKLVPIRSLMNPNVDIPKSSILEPAIGSIMTVDGYYRDVYSNQYLPFTTIGSEKYELVISAFIPDVVLNVVVNKTKELNLQQCQLALK